MATIAQQVLDFIGESGSTGRTFSEIHRKYGELAGFDASKRSNRGKSCGNLIGRHAGYFYQQSPGHFGLLYSWCTKTPAGRWVLAETPVTPLYRGYKNPTNTYNGWCKIWGVATL